MNEVTGFGELRYIARFPGYAFAECGRVISYSRKEPFAMKGMMCGKYLAASLKRESGEHERIYVHRAIAEAFHGPCPEGMECRHLDGDTLHNAPANLAWGTREQNARDKVTHNTAPIGERHGGSKLTEDIVREMRHRREATGLSYHKIAAEFDVSPMTAHRAITGQSWRNA